MKPFSEVEVGDWIGSFARNGDKVLSVNQVDRLTPTLIILRGSSTKLRRDGRRVGGEVWGYRLQPITSAQAAAFQEAEHRKAEARRTAQEEAEKYEATPEVALARRIVAFLDYELSEQRDLSKFRSDLEDFVRGVGI